VPTRTIPDKTVCKSPSTCTADTRHPHRPHNGVVCCCVQHTVHASTYHALSMGMPQHFLFFCPRWPWPLTLTFELGRDFCTVHLTAKFHHPTFNRSEIIVLTNKLTNWQTNRLRLKHPPRSAVLWRWLKIHTMHMNWTFNMITRGPGFWRYYWLTTKQGHRGYQTSPLHSQTPLCTARLMVKGCHCVGDNAERGRAEAPSLCVASCWLPSRGLKPCSTSHMTFYVKTWCHP